MTLEDKLLLFVRKKDNSICTFNLFSDSARIQLKELVKNEPVEALIELALNNSSIDQLLKVFVLNEFWDEVLTESTDRFYFPQHTIHSFDLIKSHYLLAKFNQLAKTSHVMQASVCLRRAAELGSFAAIETYVNHMINEQGAQPDLNNIDEIYKLLKSSIELHFAAGAMLFAETIKLLCQCLSDYYGEDYASQINYYYQEAREALYLAQQLKNEFKIPLFNAYFPERYEAIDHRLNQLENYFDNMCHFGAELREQIRDNAQAKSNRLIDAYEYIDDRLFVYEDRCRELLNNTQAIATASV